MVGGVKAIIRGGSSFLGVWRTTSQAIFSCLVGSGVGWISFRVHTYPISFMEHFVIQTRLGFSGVIARDQNLVK